MSPGLIALPSIGSGTYAAVSTNNICCSGPSATIFSRAANAELRGGWHTLRTEWSRSRGQAVFKVDGVVVKQAAMPAVTLGSAVLMSGGSACCNAARRLGYSNLVVESGTPACIP